MATGTYKLNKAIVGPPLSQISLTLSLKKRIKHNNLNMLVRGRGTGTLMRLCQTFKEEREGHLSASRLEADSNPSSCSLEKIQISSQ